MNVRFYGEKPFKAALIHGGPGAAGDMKIVCETLSKDFGVLEPLQTQKSIEGQLSELKDTLEKHAPSPIVLIGHSWGAMLSFMFASKYPHLVKKLVMVSSGNLEAKYASKMQENRTEKFGQLSDHDKHTLEHLQEVLQDKLHPNRNQAFATYGTMMNKLDAYDPCPIEVDTSLYNADIFHAIWTEASTLRNSGQLLEMGKNIRCNVTAIHGEDDSHPAHGVKASLEKVIQQVSFFTLEKCGHTPWLETHAKDDFYALLLDEMSA